MKRAIVSRRIVEVVKQVLSGILKPEDYEVEDINHDWVSILINCEFGVGLKDLKIIGDVLSHELDLDDACFGIFFSPKEEIERIEFGFLLPYPKKLTETDILNKFMYIDSDWRGSINQNYFPRPDEEFVVESYGKLYVAKRTNAHPDRVYIKDWFNDHSDLKPGDIVIFQKPCYVRIIPESYEYLLTLCSHENVPKWISDPEERG